MAVIGCYCDKCDVDDILKYHHKETNLSHFQFCDLIKMAIANKKYKCAITICSDENYKPSNYTAKIFFSADYVDGLKFLRSKKVKFSIGLYTCDNNHDNVECVKYLHSINCKWSTATTRHAARYGHIKSLIYMIDNGCPSNEEACFAATRNRHWGCVQYLCDHGCLFDAVQKINTNQTNTN